MQKIVQKTKYDINYYYVSYLFYNIARSMPQPILTLILISKGLSISQTILLQFFLTAASFIFEIPSGYLSDKYGRKIILLLSYVLITLVYFLVWFVNTPIMLFPIWFIYGISLAMLSGTIDIEFSLRFKHDNEMLTKFLSNTRFFYFFSCLCGAILGPLLYNYIGLQIYLISVVLFIFSILFVLSIEFKYENVLNEKNTNTISKSLFYLSSTDKKLYFIKFVLSRSIIIPLYILWQPIFVEFGIENSALFSLVYVLIMCTGMFSAKSESKLKSESYNIVKYLTYLTIVFGIISFNFVLLIVTFFVIIYFVQIYTLKCEINFKANINQTIASTLTSTAGTCTAIASCLVTLSAAFFNRIGLTSRMELTIFLLVFTVILFILEKVEAVSHQN